MSLSPFRPVPRWQRVLRSSAVGFSILFHLLLALLIVSNPAEAKKAAQWVEVAIQETKPPPPPPEPEPPKPEPPKPKPPPPKVVKFEETTPTPTPPDAAPPPPQQTPRPVRRIQGINANSFAPGANTGLDVRAGNSTAVAAGKETMNLGEATGPVEARPYTAVTKAPRLQWTPSTEPPKEAQKAGVKGFVKVLVDIDTKGKVTAVRVVQGLGYGADEWCVESYRQSRWKPAEQDGVPVAVTGVPESCEVREI